MKRILTFTSILISAFLSAQPVIDGGSFIQAGDVFEYSQVPIDQIDESEIQLAGGADLTWDFTELLPITPPLIESYFPIDSTPTLFALFFGNEFLAGQNFSTHALSIDALDFELPIPVELENGYQFYRNDDEGYFITGNAVEFDGLPLISAYDTLDRVLKFPLNFGDADTNRFYFFTEVSGIGAVGQSGRRINSVDAWGSVSTPLGTFECLRVRTVLNVTDTLFLEFTQDGGTFIRPEQVNYTWISPEIGGILAEATYLAGELSAFRYLSLESALTTISKIEASFTIYPNPTRDMVTVSAPSESLKEVRIADLTGRTVMYQSFRSEIKLDLESLPEGLYLVMVESGENRQVRRLVINR